MQSKGTVKLDKNGIIVISGHVDTDVAVETIRLLSVTAKRIRSSSEHKSVGFLLDSHGGDHGTVKAIIENMKALRKEGFMFYVLVRNAHSAVTLIVAVADKDKRFIYKDGLMTFHDGQIVLEANEINGQRQISEEKYAIFDQALLYYRRHIWGKVQGVPGFDQSDFDATQLAIYTATNRLEIKAEHCISQLRFQPTEYVLALD